MSTGIQIENILDNMFGTKRPMIKPSNAEDRRLLIKQLRLNYRELQTLRYASHGFTSSDIGFKLNLSPETIDTYRKKIFRKLNTSNMVQAVAFCIRNKIIE